MSRTENAHLCTLTDDDAARRLEADRALFRRVVGTERTDDGLRVLVDDEQDSRHLVDTFVDNERRCCGFFDLTVTEIAGSVVLEITAPADDAAQRLVDDAQQAFTLGPDAVSPGGQDRG